MRKTLTFLLLALASPLAAQTTLIRGAQVFDGKSMLGVRDVLVVNGRIADVSPKISAPQGATVVEAAGKTLLPGLIDSHTHVFGDALEQALVFGVTTELDMFTDVQLASQLRAEQKKGNVSGRADIFSAGTLVTAPKGHGTEYGMSIPTITTPDSAQAFVDARIAEGSDYIKIVYDDGKAYGTLIPTVSPATLRAVISAAHKRGKLAVVHVGQAAFAREALAAGADGLVHLFTDEEPPADFTSLAVSGKAFVIPTLTVLHSITGKPGSGDIVSDTGLMSHLAVSGRSTIRSAFPFPPGARPREVRFAQSAIRQLVAAGVPILAGTDAPNPGTAHGIGMHRELELLVQSGLTSTQALAAATSVPAKAFGLKDRGTIAKGMRADLLLVTGDPTTNIKATRAIDGVWKGGERVDRAAFAAAVAKAVADANKGRKGPVSNFDDGTTRAEFGTGWSVTTDKMAGGSSATEMKVVDGGANGTQKSLGVTGTIVGPLPYAWGGVMFMPGSQPMQAVNLSAAKTIEFWAKGDGKTYRLMLFSQSKGMTPLIKTFVAGSEWAKIELPFSDFGVDGSDILGIGFTGGPAAGTFSMQIDEVVLR